MSQYKREDWQSGYDLFVEARNELSEAKNKFRYAANLMIESMKDCSVAEAYELGLIRFNFSTEGLTKRDISRILKVDVPEQI